MTKCLQTGSILLLWLLPSLLWQGARGEVCFQSEIRHFVIVNSPLGHQSHHSVLTIPAVTYMLVVTLSGSVKKLIWGMTQLKKFRLVIQVE